MKLKLLIITLTAGLVYGLIEAIILLISEKTIEDKIYEWEINRQHYFDRFAAGLLTGGVASTIALLVSGFLAKIFREKLNIEENIFIDALGIFIGCIVITISYILYKLIRTKIRNKKKGKSLNDMSEYNQEDEKLKKE